MSDLKKRLADFITQGGKDNTGGHTASTYKKKPKDSKKEDSERNNKLFFIKEAYSPTEPLEIEVISG